MFPSRKGIKVGEYLLKNPPIGEGSFGKVYLAKNEITNNIYAVKVMDSYQILSKPTRKEKFNQELKTLLKQNNNNIIKLYDVIRTKNNFYLILEYCDGESLADFLNKYITIFNKPPPLKLIQHFTRQIISGLHYLYMNNSVHRDIKLENIMICNTNYGHQKNEKSEKNEINEKSEKNIHDLKLLTCNNDPNILKKSIDLYHINIPKENNSIQNNDPWNSIDKITEIYLNTTIKVIDLGFAKELNLAGKTISFCGSPLTMAPEIWNLKIEDSMKEYDGRVDIWSLGCVVYNLFTGNHPFISNDLLAVYKKIKVGEYYIPTDLDKKPEIIDFINGLIQFDPDNRYKWDVILNHPFIVKDVSGFSSFKEIFSGDKILNANAKDNYMDSLYLSAEDDGLNIANSGKIKSGFESVRSSFESIRSSLDMDIDIYRSVDKYIKSKENNSEDNKVNNANKDDYIDQLFLDEYVLVEREVEIVEEFEVVEEGFILVNFNKK